MQFQKSEDQSAREPPQPPRRLQTLCVEDEVCTNTLRRSTSSLPEAELACLLDVLRAAGCDILADYLITSSYHSTLWQPLWLTLETAGGALTEPKPCRMAWQ
ncbi:hypothetical protein ACKKBF_B40875 [Auxenochlorella protothecoides x Auxenochlorella symbiontica]